MRRLPVLLIAVLALLAAAAPAAMAKQPGHHHKAAKACKTNKHGKGCAPTLRVLGINDFHGNLEPPTGSGGRVSTGPNNQTVDAGGAVFLGTWVKRLQAEKPNSMFVGAGDLIGASPLISGLFHDEPTIESLSAMGMDASSVGNHEFDEGITELQRMQNGGCHPVDGCQDGDGFAGASFDYLAANVRYDGTQKTIFPPYLVRKVGGVKVAFIGLTLTGTPLIVTPDGVRGLAFDDEATTINKAVHKLQKTQKVHSFVVLIHQGGQQNPPFAKGYQDVNSCENPTGDIFSIVPKLSSDVDVVMSAHTHQPYICRVGGKLVTSAASFGRLITKLDLTFSSATKDITSEQATNVIVTRDVAQDPAQKRIVDKYKALSAPIANRVVGSTTAPITDNDPNPAGESALGDVIADAQLDATSPPSLGGAVVAFMNPGGIRADLPAGQITYNDLYTTQPFANTLVVKTLTGAQIKALLEQQFDNPAAGAVRLLQVSRGFSYSYDLTRPAGSRVDAASIKIGGTTIDPAAPYRVTMNSFLATGGDGFTVFNQGTDQLGGAVDIDALEAYFKANSPVPPGPRNRVTKTG
jgi:5'-nucleotidase